MENMIIGAESIDLPWIDQQVIEEFRENISWQMMLSLDPPDKTQALRAAIQAIEKNTHSRGRSQEDNRTSLLAQLDVDLLAKNFLSNSVKPIGDMELFEKARSKPKMGMRNQIISDED